MTKDAVWPACLDLYDVCFIVSRYRKSFFSLRIGHLTQCRCLSSSWKSYN
jgi:hypothetical protein